MLMYDMPHLPGNSFKQQCLMRLLGSLYHSNTLPAAEGISHAVAAHGAAGASTFWVWVSVGSWVWVWVWESVGVWVWVSVGVWVWSECVCVWVSGCVWVLEVHERQFGVSLLLTPPEVLQPS